MNTFLLFFSGIKMSRYVRKTDRQSWSEEEMANAVKAVVNGEMGYRKASNAFNVPQTTLERKVKKAREQNISSEKAAEKKLGRYQSVFSKDQENELMQHILTLEERLFGLTLTDLRKLAFELAEANNINHPFNKEKQLAGKDWLYGFLKRHPKLSLRNPEPTSMARAKGFNRNAVGQFFDLLESLLKEHKFSPNEIYNVDETGIMTVPNKPSKVLALRGKKQVGALSSTERGVLVTAETCMNAAGNFMPVMFVFPRKRENPLLMDDAPPGSFAVYHESGWINKDTFLIWFKKFVEFSNPTREKPVLLILDGHNSHTKSLNLINLAREKNVILLCFPPHTTHRLQPLDVSFMAPLSAYYEQEVRRWLVNHPGRVVTIYQVGKLFNGAFTRAASVENAVKGFEKSGICPFNRNIFPDHLFAPSETTERPLAVSQETPLRTATSSSNSDFLSSSATRPGLSSTGIGSSTNAGLLPSRPTVISLPTDDIALVSSSIAKSSTPVSVSSECESNRPTSSTSDPQPSTSGCQSFLNSSFNVPPKMLMPPPQEPERMEKKSNDKRRGKTAILTSSPYKIELETELKEKEEKKNRPKQRKKLFSLQHKSQKEATVRTSESKKKNSPTKPATNEKVKSSKGEKRKLEEKTSSSDDEESDASCIFCNEFYIHSKGKEGWIQCSGCSGWAHEACSNVEEEDDFFVCDFCGLVNNP